MTRRQKYFLKQKLIGLGIIIAAILLTLFVDGGGVACICMLPIGLMMVLTKEMIWMDSYFFEMEEKREFRRKMRRGYR